MTVTGFFDIEGCDLAAFADLTSRRLDHSELRHAARIDRNVPIYDAPSLPHVLNDPVQRRGLLAEWSYVLGQSSGIVVLKNAYTDTSPLDKATQLFNEIIDREKQTSAGSGDHFAKAGANDRVWNALQKHCLADPEGFALYYGNPVLAAVCEAWLGPHYQMTAQVNLVHPGGAAQTAHRDYHLGFQTAKEAARFPAHVHDLSAVMTLQGAVAHCDMPVDSGPTKLLPFSQLYRPGYLAYRLEEFQAYFEEHCLQIPLSKGDALFFNPALFHAAGENRTSDIQRFANLLQVSSALGRSLEAVDRSAMCRALYPAIQTLKSKGRLSLTETEAAIAATAEGYPFPTNLDSDPPLGGLAPESQNALFHRALAEGLTPEAFNEALAARDTQRLP